jgi:hypothetical protein
VGLAEREREREKGKKINKIEEFWHVCCSLLYNKSVFYTNRAIEATPIYLP